MEPFTRPEPKLSETGQENAVRRRERLAAALRENLRRRKEQSRGRKDAAAGEAREADKDGGRLDRDER